MIIILILRLAAAGRSAAAADTPPAISMELTRTEHGDAVISLAELASGTRAPKEAQEVRQST